MIAIPGAEMRVADVELESHSAGPNEDPSSVAQDVIASALQAASAAGLDRKFFLTGLWHSAISTILQEAEIDILVAVLEDKMILTKGNGTNADCPFQDLSPADVELRQVEVTRIAEIILDYVEPMIEHLDDEETDAIDVFLTAVLTILREKWGPFHLRRVLKDQVQAFRDGVKSPIAPIEPSLPNQTKERAPARKKAPPPQPTSPIKRAPVYRPGKGRKIEMSLQAEVTERGIGVFGVAIRIFHGSDILEHREIAGSLPKDTIGRRSLLLACLSAFRSLGEPGDGELVTVYSSSDYLINMMSSPLGLTLTQAPEEKELLDAIAPLIEGRNLNWTHRKPGLGTELSARCDRLVRTVERAYRRGEAS